MCENKKTLKETLLHTLPANVYVEITDAGYRVGMTYIDYEDLFIHSLNGRLLDKKVEEVVLKDDKDFTCPIYEVRLV
jgi:hypothetical protein